MTTQRLNNARERDARQKIAWFAGTARHPNGTSGSERVIVCEADQAACWDTTMRGWKYSEYGNNAGFDI